MWLLTLHCDHALDWITIKIKIKMNIETEVEDSGTNEDSATCSNFLRASEVSSTESWYINKSHLEVSYSAVVCHETE